MDFATGEQQQMIREAVRSFADKSARGAAAGWDRERGWNAAAQTALAHLGFFGLAAPESAGGLGLDASAWTAAFEEIATADAGAAQALVAHQSAVTVLVGAGTAAQQAQWLDKLVSGAALGCLAHEDDAANLDSQVLKTMATPEGAGWILSGTKPFVVLGAKAQVAVLTAQVQGQGATAFLVPLSAGGVQVKASDSLGLRSAAAATLHLGNVMVGADQLLGAVGAAAAVLANAREEARLGTAAVALGLARGALREAGKYAAERQQFGKPISAFQPIQWMIANSATEIEAARLLLERAAWLRARAKPASQAIAMAKVQATEAAVRSADRALQVHGGYGYTKDFPVERMLRDAAVLQIIGGSRDLQRVDIAKSLSAA